MSTERPVYASVDGQILKLTNLEKPLFPSTGFTKRDLMRYYRRVSSTVLPYLKGRPFTLRRFPQGVGEESFFEKNCPSHRPGWLPTFDFEGVNHCLIESEAALVWIANLAAIELHVTLARIPDLQCPTIVAFDLDPGAGAGLQECAVVALLLKDRMEDFGLQSVAKTSGSKGLHLYVPLNTPTSYEQTGGFAREMAESLATSFPDRVTANMSKKLRSGRVFVDWSQNTDFKTTACVYSLRATAAPQVSTPLTWTEVRGIARNRSDGERALGYGPEDVVQRLASKGDLFSAVLKLRQRLPSRDARRRAA